MKALILLSGGLDSRLACKILQEQKNIEIEAIFFILPFTGGCCSDKFCVFKFCQQNNIKLHIIDCTKGKLFAEYLSIIRHPKHPRGTALNPCRDCHLFMFKKAKEFADKNKIGIIASGEVLGERPLSQTKKALAIIDNELAFEILRPLSAKMLKETEYEKKGLVDRNMFLEIYGRRRNNQLELAKKYGIIAPPVGGGCLLCEKTYCEKLKPVLNTELNFQDIKLINVGRHFPGIIIGRREKENIILESSEGIKVIPVDNPGPTALVYDKKDIDRAKELINKHSKQKITEFEIKY